MTSTVRFTLNGSPVEVEVDNRALLVDVLRERLGKTGTHVGCDTSQCGACTVMLDGNSVKSCTVLSIQVEGASVTSIEGLAAGNRLHPIQQAFIDCHGLQCGFCTPGMVMTAACLLQRVPHPSEQEIVHALEGNLCRCTGYVNIIAAVSAAAEAMQPSLQGAL